jgi:hypothetical protein
MIGKVVSVTLILIGGAFSAPLYVQQGSAGSSADASNEFHVDGSCRVHETVTGPKGSKDHTYRDRGICAVDPVHVSYRTETDIASSPRKRTHVTIREHTFTFHNPTTQPAVFVLEQVVPKGWEIDSDPQPDKVEGTVARFLIHAEPRQTVSVHVGMRNPPGA